MQQLNLFAVRSFQKLSRSRHHHTITNLINDKVAGVCFDIDGVIIRGSKPIKNSVEAIKHLEECKIPYLFLTNSSGTTETKKAASLSKTLGYEIDPKRIQLASTPLREVKSKYHDKLVLFVGKDVSARHVAEDYDFKHFITSEEYHTYFPDAYPDVASNKSTDRNLDHELVHAIFVIADPIPWGRDLQIIIDLLRSKGRADLRLQNSELPAHQLPIYFSTADFEYASNYPLPRFGSGSFLFALKALYKEVTGGVDLKYELSGKPYASTFDYAARTLRDMSFHQQNQSYEVFDRGLIYMIGDNPLSDIAGANAAGDKWRSVLVCSGMFNKDDAANTNPANHVADLICADAYEAVHEITTI